MLSQQLVNGLVLGSTYALFALGFTLIFGVLRVINLTYGFYFSVGAFVALTVARELRRDIWVALPLGALSARAGGRCCGLDSADTPAPGQGRRVGVADGDAGRGAGALFI